jgi:hypothetical protein
MKNQFGLVIRSVNSWLVVAFLLISSHAFGQERQSIYFYSANEEMPLAYLRVQVVEGRFMDFTDIKGKLEYLKQEIPQNSLINISGYGINDTLISTQQVMSLDTIFLNTKEFELPEVAINSSQLSELKIGDSSAEGWEVTKPIALSRGEEGDFYRYTIRVKVPKSKQLLLDEIKFYVSKILAEKVDVSLRVLIPSTTKRIMHGKMNSIVEFTDVLPSNKIIAVTKSGWQQINFNESVQIPIGVSDLFIIFDLIEKIPKSRFAIIDQQTSKDIDLGFYYSSGKIGVFPSNRFHPAVEITFLKE